MHIFPNKGKKKLFFIFKLSNIILFLKNVFKNCFLRIVLENLYKMGFGDSCSLFCLIDLHGPETKSLLSCIAVGSIHD